METREGGLTNIYEKSPRRNCQRRTIAFGCGLQIRREDYDAGFFVFNGYAWVRPGEHDRIGRGWLQHRRVSLPVAAAYMDCKPTPVHQKSLPILHFYNWMEEDMDINAGDDSGWDKKTIEQVGNAESLKR